MCHCRTIIDLSHTLDKNAPKYPLSEELWPNFTYYKQQILAESWINWGTEGMWLSIGKTEFYEHYGTHMDAPSHFGSGRQTMAEIPIERLIGPGVVINVKDKAKENPNYAVTKNDILEYEAKYGRIPPRAIVLMNSGWSVYYNNHKIYLGSTDLKDVTSFNFPGFGLDACEFLLGERQVSVVGVDTMSLDPGQPADVYGSPYPCHHHLQPENVPLLENVANLDAIPCNGTTIFLGGLKTRTGTGSPTRIFAIIDDDGNSKKGVSDHADVVASNSFIVLLILLATQLELL